ncbi:hypothetical protein AVEN_193095-1 [Araneus ventricosus]|uniref:Uncharacterized protein n=1 Tax=Araneus ventricosus TaxID=182803 RepID=A0A4Y2B2X6_ARAVE|nr:hypothetical protein AVEN_193095-1 [Araneus ventricosus]
MCHYAAWPMQSEQILCLPGLNIISVDVTRADAIQWRSNNIVHNNWNKNGNTVQYRSSEYRSTEISVNRKCSSRQIQIHNWLGCLRNHQDLKKRQENIQDWLEYDVAWLSSIGGRWNQCHRRLRLLQ